jgi:hypothetical protein
MNTLLNYLPDSFKSLPIQIYERWQPEAFCNRKIKQSKSNEFDKLKGTIADCKISKNRKFITKRIRQENKEHDLNQLKLLGLMPGYPVMESWTKASILEYDSEHEAMVQKKFYKLWKNSDIIKIPKVKSFTEDSIKMENFEWPRLGDIIDNKELFENAVKSTAFFFFYSIKKWGLVHGDISVFNILVDPESTNGRICVIDYGMTGELNTEDLNKIKEIDNLTGYPALMAEAWNKEGFQFSMEWWSKINLLEIHSNNISGVYARSLISLTKLACMSNLIVQKSYIMKNF